MNGKQTSLAIATILLAVIAILLAACGGTSTTPMPALPSPTSVPPTNTSLPPTKTPIPATPTATSIDAHKYINLKVGNQWQYHLEISQGFRVIFDPFFIKPEGIIGTSATHGSGSLKYTARDFSITVIEMLSETEAKVEISDESAIPWIPQNAQDARFVIVEKDNGDLSFEIQIVPKGIDDWLLGQFLALIPADTNATSLMALQTPAGEFSTLHLVMAHPEVMNYSPAYTQETWLAEGVGLVKSITLSSNNDLIYTLELTSYDVK